MPMLLALVSFTADTCMISVAFAAARAALMQQAGQTSTPARETDRTAELDNLGILELQQDVMQEQALNLAAMEQSVASTRVS